MKRWPLKKCKSKPLRLLHTEQHDDDKKHNKKDNKNTNIKRQYLLNNKKITSVGKYEKLELLYIARGNINGTATTDWLLLKLLNEVI